jgi:hypothetical protein
MVAPMFRVEYQQPQAQRDEIGRDVAGIRVA